MAFSQVICNTGDSDTRSKCLFSCLDIIFYTSLLSSHKSAPSTWSSFSQTEATLQPASEILELMALKLTSVFQPATLSCRQPLCCDDNITSPPGVWLNSSLILPYSQPFPNLALFFFPSEFPAVFLHLRTKNLRALSQSAPFLITAISFSVVSLTINSLSHTDFFLQNWLDCFHLRQPCPQLSRTPAIFNCLPLCLQLFA